MSIKIKPLRKFTTGTPTTSNMEVGEIAVNTADKKIYMRDDSGGAGSIVEVGASSELFTGGATTNIDINGRVTAEVKQFGGRFGKDIDTPHDEFVNDDGISHRVEGGRSINFVYEKKENGKFKVTAEIK